MCTSNISLKRKLEESPNPFQKHFVFYTYKDCKMENRIGSGRLRTAQPRPRSVPRQRLNLVNVDLDEPSTQIRNALQWRAHSVQRQQQNQQHSVQLLQNEIHPNAIRRNHNQRQQQNQQHPVPRQNEIHPNAIRRNHNQRQQQNQQHPVPLQSEIHPNAIRRNHNQRQQNQQHPVPLQNEIHPNAIRRNHNQRQQQNQQHPVQLLQNEIHPNAVRRNRNQGNPNFQHGNPMENHQAQDPNNWGRPQGRNSGNNRSNQENNGEQGPRNDRRRGDRNFHVGFKKLEEWSNKDPDTIIVELMGQKMGFEELLESDLSGDWIVLVVKILAKLCLSPFKENKTQIMNLATREKFNNSLKTYVMMLLVQDKQERRRNLHFWSDVNGFLVNLAVMFQSIIETLPTRAGEVLPQMLKAITLMVSGLEGEQVRISDDNKQKFQKLQEKLDLCIAAVERKKKEVGRHQYDDEAPPDDFRQLSVYPTSQEILTDEQPFIRKHIIEGAYDDVNHYLDVQFRLLKEDFVAPLREGVCQFIHQEETHRRIPKISNVRIHPHVEFLCPRFGKDQVGVLLQFDFRTKKERPKKNFQYSKRFMFGSLVCFTKDNFATLVFGKIVERDMKLLEQGQVVIGFEPGHDNYELNQPYLMIECSVYFEPYYHVLKALQNMYEEGFPMKNYLIDVDPHIEAPRYVTPLTIYKIKNYAVPLMVPGSWPSAADLELDNTQYEAFQGALTQKFAVIQGPPGTGKTYLGLQVAKTLINNRTRWYNRTPILVVCFTNHALDQFLEGLIDTTTEIVRVGGQSKNPKLEKFNLREKRKNVHSKKGVNKALYTLRNELSNHMASIKAWSEGLDEIQKYQSIVQFKHFIKVDPEFATSWFVAASEKAIIEWLFGGRTRQQQQQEVSRARLEEMQTEGQDEVGTNAAEDSEFAEMWQNENRAQNEINVDDFLEMLFIGSNKPTYLTSVSEMMESFQEISKDLMSLGDDINNEQAVFNKKWELERKLFELQDDLEYLKMRLQQGARTRITRKPADLDLRQPHNMSPDDRWRLYFYWLHRYQQSLITKLVRFQTVYREKYRQYIEIKDIDDTDVMKQMLVVGMTTTGAARLQTTLQALQSRIVIVEEAAEVLESHIIVSLTNHCEHLILIGDHKQLRPSTANFRMERHFNLGISLFERMVRNKIQCYVLGVQHRMRPEIAKLIVPNIYPVLENHQSVCNFPPVLGVDPCMYFIDHDNPEVETGDFSKLNQHEAEFLIRFARYLIQNGYQPEDITILAAYSGQMFALWKERKKHQLLLQDVRITVLDNYQGEESRIILLSLVRNNEDKRIGFLKIENRVCVALSRAKEGFFMMGNMDLLCENSEIWPKVKTSLESQDFFGKSLTLRCQIHREEVTRVKSAEDFDRVPEGGCSKVCEIVLNCGHRCTKICHITDRSHEESKCIARCSKILCENNHQCPKMCHQECGLCIVPMKQTLACGHQHVVPCYMDPKDYQCKTHVKADLPCGHTVTDKPCYLNAETYKCPFPCDTRVEPCGHACPLKCHIRSDPDHLQYKCYKPCAKLRKGCSTGLHICPKTCFEECVPCDIVVRKARTVCTHQFYVPCNVNVDKVNCHKPCKKALPCGHICKQKCYESCGNCQEKVDKVLPECGHSVKAKCCEEPSRKNCRGQCPRRLSCGHTCKKKCNEPCTAMCKDLVDHAKPVDCGHRFKISCYLRTQELPSNSHRLLKFCQEPCGTLLACKHICLGTCGGCAQGRIHETCKERCGVPLICGHECPIPCREACQPCNQHCSYRCKHSKCKKKCGEPCTNCKEDCGRRCRHTQCTKKCGDICNVPPCTEPCPSVLECEHPCIGFCGDPCPPLCRICDNEELTEVFFGFEDEEDARFVLLDECKHIIESRGMEEWLQLQQEGNAINYKSCPKCKTPLASTQRYSDYIKLANRDVVAVKKKFYGNVRENEQTRTKLLGNLEDLQENCTTLLFYSSGMIKLLEDFKTSLSPVRNGRKQPLNMLLARVYTAKIQLVQELVDTFNEANLKNVNVLEKAAGHVNFILKFLLEQEQRITNQEIEDIQREIRRFQRIAQLCQIEDCGAFRPVIASKPSVRALFEEVNRLAFSVKIYSDVTDASLKSKLVDLSKLIEAGVGITDKERREIVQAMGLRQGHWYKCPNGHVYAIGDCGGANQVSKCNECGATIGGHSHRLATGNRHAGEMDGSRHAAWSEAANNLLNFEEFRNQL